MDKRERLIIQTLTVICLLLLFSTTVFAGSNADSTVYVTNTGECYHIAGCSYLKSSNAITLQNAVNKGYRPCSRCHPPTLDDRSAADSKASNDDSNTLNLADRSYNQAAISTDVSDSVYSNGDVTVYVADTSKDVYHRKDCSYLKYSSNAITLQKAFDQGRRACSRCHPPILGETKETDSDPYVTYNANAANSKSPSNNQETTSENNSRGPSQGIEGNIAVPSSNAALMKFVSGVCIGGIAVYYIKSTIEAKQKHKAEEERLRLANEERKRLEDEKRFKYENERRSFILFLNGRSIREIADVPPHIRFINGLPVDNNDAQYGSFTVYISKNGRRYHLRKGCSSASIAQHIYNIPSYYTPCSVCCGKYKTKPTYPWFQKYKDLCSKCEKYNVPYEQ